MKCTIPEISWHNREPVLSVDLHPDLNSFYRLATGGGDCHVLIWQVIIEDNGSVQQEVISDLKRHQKSVNVVKWSPTGAYLASADDDANIIIWQLKTDNIPSLDDESNDKETWNVFKILRGHKEDIYDLCWSPSSLKLLSGSIDNTAILWDMHKGKSEQILTDHKGFVQGVAWDPKDKYIATISTDRICRIFDNLGKQVRARIAKGYLPVPPDHPLHEKEVKYFHDDTFKSFFRRLCFSSDGSILIVPSGHIIPEEGKAINCTFIFVVETNVPAAVLPLPKQNSTVVKCCPMYFELREDGPEPYINLPYRILFAVGTDHDIILYDTQQSAPFARFNNIHYTRLTDLTWSGDGLLLIASSTDGFCTVITFEPNELGVQYIKEESDVEDNVTNVSTPCEAMEVVDISEDPPPKIKETSEKPEKPNVKVLTPRRIKRAPVPEKNASILSFFKKTTDQTKESLTSSCTEKSADIKNSLHDGKSKSPNTEQILSDMEVSISEEVVVNENIQTIEEKSEDCEKESNEKLGNGNTPIIGESANVLKVTSKENSVNSAKKPRRITPSRVS